MLSWFQRVSAFFIRFLHTLIYVRHCLLMCVDDMLFFQDEPVLALMAVLILAICAIFGASVGPRLFESTSLCKIGGPETHLSR